MAAFDEQFPAVIVSMHHSSLSLTRRVLCSLCAGCGLAFGTNIPGREQVMPHCPVCQSKFERGVQYCPNDGARLIESDTPKFDPMVGLLLDDRYRIIAPIGEGAMGRVYRACQVKVGRDVAVKVLNAQSSQDKTVVRRFESEAMIISRLKHPNTLKLFDFGETPDHRLFIVVELLEGRSLEQALNEGPLPQLETLRVMRQALKALNEAHAAGIVHRDIKPANIMLELVGGTQVVKVLDFGIARMLSNVRHTATGGVVGTPAYMSPEQIRGLEVDHRSDLYSLGVVAYECLTGVLPFSASTPHAMMLEHTKVEPTPMRERLPMANINASVDQFVISLMQKIPEDRPASALAAVRMIDRLEQELLRARPETTPVQIVRTPKEVTKPDHDALGLFEFSEDTIPLADRLKRKKALKQRKAAFYGKGDRTQPEGASGEKNSNITGAENTDADQTDAPAGSEDLTPTDDPALAAVIAESVSEMQGDVRRRTAEFGDGKTGGSGTSSEAAVQTSDEISAVQFQDSVLQASQPDVGVSLSPEQEDALDAPTGPNPVVIITPEEIKASSQNLPTTVESPSLSGRLDGDEDDQPAKTKPPVRRTGRQTSPSDGPELDEEYDAFPDPETQLLSDGPWKASAQVREKSSSNLVSQLRIPDDDDHLNLADNRVTTIGWFLGISALAGLALALWHYWPTQPAQSTATKDQKPAFERTVKPK